MFTHRAACVSACALPLVRTPARDPKWLQLQREVNDLVISIAAARPLSWASTRDAPFVSKAGIVDLPQPDYVLIEGAAGVASELVFGEHDRGNEAVERFIARKIVPYVDLVRFPLIDAITLCAEKPCITPGADSRDPPLPLLQRLPRLPPPPLWDVMRGSGRIWERMELV
ncbi:MAG: hypothetical protein WA208_15315 [Thermoanaerobaculia bacterium]